MRSLGSKDNRICFKINRSPGVYVKIHFSDYQIFSRLFDQTGK